MVELCRITRSPRLITMPLVDRLVTIFTTQSASVRNKIFAYSKSCRLYYNTVRCQNFKIIHANILICFMCNGLGVAIAVDNALTASVMSTRSCLKYAAPNVAL